MCVLHVQDSFCRIFALKHNRKRQDELDGHKTVRHIIVLQQKGRMIYVRTKTKEKTRKQETEPAV